VIGLKSYARSGVTVIPDAGKISELPSAERYIVVSQTTFDRGIFEKIIRLLKEKLGDRIVVFDTICDSTRDRQSDVASAIARGIDVLVVVGGRNSANTRRLADIGRERGIRTFHVETADESFKKTDHVFITAGASTPGWIINNVLEKLFSIQYSHRGFIVSGAKKLIEFIVRTNVLSSFAAFFLTAFSIFYFSGNSTFQLPLAAALYLFSMYSFNNCLTAPQLRESNPYKYQLYHLHRLPFLITASLGTLIALLLVIPFGPAAWGMYSASSALGIVYSMNFFQAMIKKPGIALLSKAYNSKTLVTSFGWVIVCALVPLSAMRAPLYAYPAMLCFIFGFVFLRNIMLDIIGLQGDLILGRETLPILLGLKPAVKIAAAAGFFCFAVFCIITAMRGNTAFLIPAAAYPYYLILVHRICKMEYLAALKYEFLTDVNFVFFIALYWVSSSL
jgi:hypothetical protein